MSETVMQKVERFRDGIESAKTEKTRLETQLDAVDAELKDDFGAATLAKAKEVLTKEQDTETRLGSEVADGLTKLEEKYDW